MQKIILGAFIYILVILLFFFYFPPLWWSAEIHFIIAVIFIFVGLCAFIYFLYEKLNERLDKIEKQLNGEDQSKQGTIFRSKTPKN